MNMPGQDGRADAAEKGDSDWSDVTSRPQDDHDDEPRTISYTGIVPRRLERDNAHYVIIDGASEAKGRRFEVAAEPVIVGRSVKCNIVVPDSRVSSRHLQLRVVNDVLMIEDLNSSNGTFLNGQRVAGPVEFGTDALVQIGEHAIRHEFRSRTDVNRESSQSADLRKARSFIEALLPKPLTEGPERTGWHFVPCATLGGDAFGYHYLDQDRMAIYLLDVCGHGAGAAMLSVSAMNAIRRQSLPKVDFSDSFQVLQGLNDVFQMDDHDGMYFSIWYGIYDRRNRVLSYSAAGHPPALLVSPAGTVTRLGTKAMAIGILPSLPVARERMTIAPGDRLYLFSDGVFEIKTREGREWSFDEFEREVMDGAGPIEREGARLHGRVSGLSAKTELDDDFSIVVLDFKE